MEKISVIVPIYKAEKFIERTVRSVISQTYTHWELILVIDGSPDDSVVVCRKMAEQDRRIIVVEQENRGAHGARLTGLHHSDGAYVAFLDSDDLLPPYSLEVMAAEIGNGCDIVKGVVCVNNATPRKGKNEYQTKSLTSKEFIEQIFLGDLDAYMCGSLFCRNLLDDYIFNLCIKNKLTIGEDFTTNLYIGKHISQAKIINECTYVYCENPNGVMNTISMSDEYGLRIGKINRMILGDGPQWNYAKLLKKATCVSNFFNPSRSFQHEEYQALKTFIATYGKEPLYRYIDRRFLWFCQYKFIYRIYSWCYRKAKGLKKGKKKTIK